MQPAVRIRWGLVLIGGLLAEVVVLGLFVAVVSLASFEAGQYVTPGASFAGTFLLAVWVGRRLESSFILHGLLIGGVAVLVYTGLSLLSPESGSLPLVYIVAHAFKLLGGLAGGLVAHRRKGPAALKIEPESAFISKRG